MAKKTNLFTKKKVTKMATASFDREIIVKDKKAVDVLMNGLSQDSNKQLPNYKIDVEEEFKRGKSALRKFSSHSKKSYQK
ncbi:MAG: hypothetical protein CVV03_02260 [Firmicutes bacterium HGW-Firmicutes-8]|nr:MAG: hypothetical protein CVV03_02260 [Firmicutes bacterium HGW-Firmicutes-8]